MKYKYLIGLFLFQISCGASKNPNTNNRTDNDSCETVSINFAFNADTTINYKDSLNFPLLFRQIAKQQLQGKSDNQDPNQVIFINLLFQNSIFTFEQHVYTTSKIQTITAVSVSPDSQDKSIRESIQNLWTLKPKPLTGSDKFIIVDEQISSERFETILGIIIDEYNKEINRESNATYQRTFCNLTENEKNKITSLKQFKIKFLKSL